jgi:hypothetical protein
MSSTFAFNQAVASLDGDTLVLEETGESYVMVALVAAVDSDSTVEVTGEESPGRKSGMISSKMGPKISA